MSQVIEGLPNGRYTVSVLTDATATGAFLFANNSQADLSTNTNGVSSVTVDVTDGQLEFGVKLVNYQSGWVKFDKFTLTAQYLSNYATTVELGETELNADTWYVYTIPTDGDYTFTASNLSDITATPTNQLAGLASGALSETMALAAGTKLYFKSATAQTLTIAYVTPVVQNGDYYLYDAANKVFLSRGANYGSRAVVDKYGVPFTWNNYTKTLVFKDWPGVNMIFDKDDHSNCWLYTDGGTNNANRFFAFETADESGGLYLRDNTKSVYVRHDGTVVNVPTTSATDATVWKVLTKAERDAIVNAYPTDNKASVIAAASLTGETDAAGLEAWLAANRAAKDRTSSVGTAKFAGSAGSWTWTANTNGGAATYGTDWTEAYQTAVGTWSQTISDLPQGIYKVTVNAFERAAGYALCNTLGAEGWEPVTAYFKANGEQIPLKSWYSQKEGTNNPNTTTEAATAFNNDKYKNEIYAYVGNDGQLTITIGKPSKANGSWVLFNNVTLTYYDTNVSEEDATAILSEASTQLTQHMKASLWNALSTAKTTFDASRTVPNYNALRAAIDNTTTSVTSYGNMYTNYLSILQPVVESTNFVDAATLNTMYTQYKNAYERADGCTDIENAAANALSVTRGNGTNYTSTYSQLLLPSWKIGSTAALTNNSGFYINSWSVEGDSDGSNFKTPFFEYWTGDANELSATTLTGTQAGLTANTLYKVTAWVRVRERDDNTKTANGITMQVGDGEAIDVVSGTQIGTSKLYHSNYSAIGQTDSEGNLTLKFNVASGSNVSWLAFQNVNFEAVTAVADAKAYLNSCISSANAIKNANNTGTGIFQIPTSVGETFETAISTATSLYNNESASFDDITGGISAIQAAVTEYTNAKLNAPDAGKRYKLTLANKGTLTFVTSSTEGGYGMPFKAAADHLAQTFTLTNISGNNYTLSFVDLEGNTRYICTRADYGQGGTGVQGIRTTTEAGKALQIKIAATATAGVFNMLNTAAGNAKLGAQNNGDFYTVADNSSWTIAEAAQAEVDVNIAAGKFATRIFPFTPTLPEGVDAYVAGEVSDGKLTLTKEDSPAANKPYILFSKNGYTGDVLTGWGTAAADSYAEGSMTGVYTAAIIPQSTETVKNYILATDDEGGVQSFYIVDTDDYTASPYRAYLTLNSPAEQGARLRIAFADEANAIDTVSATDETEVEAIYSVDGTKLNTLQTGLNIVKFTDGTVKKVYVK